MGVGNTITDVVCSNVNIALGQAEAYVATDNFRSLVCDKASMKGQENNALVVVGVGVLGQIIGTAKEICEVNAANSKPKKEHFEQEVPLLITKRES